MSTGPENRFIQSVHKLVSRDVHREKMHNPYRGGTADVWYSGRNADMWLEYKWITGLPKDKLTPNLSELQKLWLRGRHKEGRLVHVVVGSPGGVMIFSTPNEWERGISMDEVKPLLVQKKDLAGWIELVTLGRTDGHTAAPQAGGTGRLGPVQGADSGLADLRAGDVQILQMEDVSWD